jgi:hypothetical protein
MRSSAEYRDLAEQCLRLAETVKMDYERQVLREMAEAWNMLADETDREHSTAPS